MANDLLFAHPKGVYEIVCSWKVRPSVRFHAHAKHSGLDALLYVRFIAWWIQMRQCFKQITPNSCINHLLKLTTCNNKHGQNGRTLIVLQYKVWYSETLYPVVDCT